MPHTQYLQALVEQKPAEQVPAVERVAVLAAEQEPVEVPAEQAAHIGVAVRTAAAEPLSRRRDKMRNCTAPYRRSWDMQSLPISQRTPRASI